MKSPPVVGSAGWLGLLLGSRLYFRVTPVVLADSVQYEAAVDDIVQEVRRRAPVDAPGPRDMDQSPVVATSPSLHALTPNRAAVSSAATSREATGAHIDSQVTLHANHSVVNNNVSSSVSNTVNTGNGCTTIVL